MRPRGLIKTLKRPFLDPKKKKKVTHHFRHKILWIPKQAQTDFQDTTLGLEDHALNTDPVQTSLTLHDSRSSGVPNIGSMPDTTSDLSQPNPLSQSELDPTMREVYGKILDLEELLHKSEKNLKSGKVSAKKRVYDDDHKASEDISVLTYARSMSVIKQHPQFKDIFMIDHDTSQVKCNVCKSSSKLFTIQDTNFAASAKEKIPAWFGGFKTSLIRHITKETHKNALRQEKEWEEELRPIRDKIRNNMRFLSYYIIKTNSAFQLFPTLLAVAQRCGVMTGDINQSRAFVTSLAMMLDKELLKNTQNWLKVQEDKSVTLVTDIGTIFGLVMSVVLFVGKDGGVRLAGCSLTTSKTGADLAELV